MSEFGGWVNAICGAFGLPEPCDDSSSSKPDSDSESKSQDDDTSDMRWWE